MVKGEVYDGTDYLEEHPGGASSIILVANEDATEDFMAIHSADAKRKLSQVRSMGCKAYCAHTDRFCQYHIGTLQGDLTKEPATSPDTERAPDAPFLDPKSWKPVKLTSIEQLNHDSFIYRFSLSSDDKMLGLPVGQHVFVRLKRKDTGEIVQRAYTPVSMENARGKLDFLVK